MVYRLHDALRKWSTLPELTEVTQLMQKLANAQTRVQKLQDDAARAILKRVKKGKPLCSSLEIL